MLAQLALSLAPSAVKLELAPSAAKLTFYLPALGPPAAELVVAPSAEKQDFVSLSAFVVPRALESLVSRPPKVQLALERGCYFVEAYSCAVMPRAATSGHHFHVVTVHA